MKGKQLSIMLAFIMMAGACQKGDTHKSNPLLGEYRAYDQAPPFDEIQAEDYLPAFREAMTRQNREIEDIVQNPETPTFDNTIRAMELSGSDLTRIQNIFFLVYGADANDTLQDIAKEIIPELTEHNSNIMLNDTLFQRIKYVAEKFNPDEHSSEEVTLVQKYEEDFIRSGADLSADKKEKIREIDKQLAKMNLEFDEHILNENKTQRIVLEKEDLDGLPDAVIQAAAEKAEQLDLPGKYVFTIQRQSMYPFLTYSTRRDLREELYRKYFMKGDNNDENDNKDIVLKTARLRMEKAKLFGYDNYARYQLANKMAEAPENVYTLLNEVWTPALKMAKNEVKEQQQLIDEEGGKFKLQPWDWWYYTEKLRERKFDFSDEDIKPYFELNRVRDGAFEIVHRLYGLTFEEVHNVPVYNKDVRVFEVRDKDGSHLGLFYTDYFPRDGKGMGAWMTAARDQSDIDTFVTPIVANVANFPRPTRDMPSLLSLDQVHTLFHELGHALHGLMSHSHYPRLAGTSVDRDFVELPSQIMENWVLEPEALKLYAKHYKTGADLPRDLLDKIIAAGKFNQGFKTVEYLAASYLDMDWHTLDTFTVRDVNAFEKESMDRIGLIPEILPRYRSTYFGHTFAGGYSAGYYSYIWAEVLDADAFQAFKETDLFNQDVAQRFRDTILARGGTENPMLLYKKFRGRAPHIDALLERRGLNGK